MQRTGRMAVAVMMLAGLLSGCVGGRVPGVPSNGHLPVAHPRDVATKVRAMVTQIHQGLAGAGSPMRPKKDATPTPCGVEALRREVRRTEPPDVNPYMNPWYTDHSPYAIGMSSSVDIPQDKHMITVFPELRDYLQKKGWRVVKYEQRGANNWELRAESPEKGYGGIIAGPVTGSRRITVTFSSPCFRHPDEIPK